MTTLELGATRVMKILESANGEWLSRSQIAARLGSRRLQLQYVYAADFLVLTGKLETRTAPTKIPTNQRIEYRLAQRGG